MVRHILIGITILAALGSSPALACPVLVKASPRVGSTVAGAQVQDVVLRFSGPVEAGLSEIRVTDEQGQDHAAGRPIAEDRAGQIVRVAVKPLPSGKYKVQWKIHCQCDGARDNIYPGNYPFTAE